MSDAIPTNGLTADRQAILDIGATAAYAVIASLPMSIPSVALYSAIASALTVGALAGLYPAPRGARLAPAEALRSA